MQVQPCFHPSSSAPPTLHSVPSWCPHASSYPLHLHLISLCSGSTFIPSSPCPNSYQASPTLLFTQYPKGHLDYKQGSHLCSPTSSLSHSISHQVLCILPTKYFQFHFFSFILAPHSGSNIFYFFFDLQQCTQLHITEHDTNTLIYKRISFFDFEACDTF